MAHINKKVIISVALAVVLATGAAFAAQTTMENNSNSVQQKSAELNEIINKVKQNQLTYEQEQSIQMEGYTLYDIQKSVEYGAVLDMNPLDILKLKENKKAKNNYDIVTEVKAIDLGKLSAEVVKLAKLEKTKEVEIKTAKDKSTERWKSIFENKHNEQFIAVAKSYGLTDIQITSLKKSKMTGMEIYEIAKLMKQYEKTLEVVTKDLGQIGSLKALQEKYAYIPLKNRVKTVKSDNKDSNINNMILKMYRISETDYKWFVDNGISEASKMAEFKLLEMNQMGSKESLLKIYQNKQQWQELMKGLEEANHVQK